MWLLIRAGITIIHVNKWGPWYEWPEHADFEEIGPENDLPNSLLVHLNNAYSDNMAEQKQTKQLSPPVRRTKIRISHI